MNIVKDITTKYGLDEFQKRVEEIEKEKSTISVAFLGEFSSGKSSLINALLNKKVLPTMDKPTSKRVVEIKASNVEKIIPYKILNDGLEEMGMMDFEDMALSSGKEKVLLEVPANDFFKEDYLIIDTPGLSSIDKMDRDITFGYLPFLDSAIITQDIQKGALPKSILDFLKKTEIKSIIENFIFAITKADTKSKDAQNKIRESIIKQLKEFGKESGLNLGDIESKVVLVSTKNSLDDFKRAFRENILEKKQKLIEQKKVKEYKKLAKEIIEALKWNRENSNLNLEDIKKRESEVYEKLDRVKNKKREMFNRVDKLSIALEKDIANILTNFLPLLQNINSQDEAENILSQIENKINITIANSISKILGESLDISVNGTLVQLNKSIGDLLNKVEMGKTLATFVIMDLLLPGTGAIGAVEGSTGVILRELGKSGAKSALKSVALKTLADVIKKVNPAEYVGDFVKEKILQSTLEKQIPILSRNIALLATNEIEKSISLIIDDINSKISAERELLERLSKEKEQKIDEFNSYLEEIDSDIKKLSSI